MRRLFVRRFAVLVLVLSIVVPASAAPRRDDDSPTDIIRRIIRIIRHILPLEEIKVAVPTP